MWWRRCASFATSHSVLSIFRCNFRRSSGSPKDIIFTSSALILLICTLSIIVVVVWAYLVPFVRIEHVSYLAINKQVTTLFGAQFVCDRQVYCVVDE